MYHHRGAYLQALAMALHAGLNRRQPLPLDAADVPLQRLVLHLGGHRGRRRPTSACARSTRPRSGGDRRGRRHPPQRRADGADRCSLATPTPRRADCAPVRIAHRRRAADAGAAGAHAGLGIEVTHLYGLTETFGPSVICDWQPEWDALPTDEQARLEGPPGRRQRDRRAGSRGRRGRRRRPRRRRDARRDRAARQRRDARLLPRPGGDRDGVSATAGSAPATSA